MKVTLTFDKNMHIIGSDKEGHITHFDTVPEVGGENTASAPMTVLLEAMAACSFMDVLAILRKKRKQIDGLTMEVEGTRADKHPKVYTKVHLKYILKSPDAELKDLERAIELSQTTYCGASAMFQRSGCEVTTEAVIL
ncbi:MAG: OsmC family protein [Candidatus Kapaibacteriota bacterium]